MGILLLLAPNLKSGQMKKTKYFNWYHIIKVDWKNICYRQWVNLIYRGFHKELPGNLNFFLIQDQPRLKHVNTLHIVGSTVTSALRCFKVMQLISLYIFI